MTTDFRFAVELIGTRYKTKHRVHVTMWKKRACYFVTEWITTFPKTFKLILNIRTTNFTISRCLFQIKLKESVWYQWCVTSQGIKLSKCLISSLSTGDNPLVSPLVCMYAVWQRELLWIFKNHQNGMSGLREEGVNSFKLGQKWAFCSGRSLVSSR